MEQVEESLVGAALNDVIFVMERVYRNRLRTQIRAHLRDKRVICLDIPDDFEYMDPSRG